MRRRVISAANRLLGLVDLQLSRNRTQSTVWTPLEAALHGLMSARGSLNVVQVGANDGKWNDPIHAFLMQEAESTNLLLIEPQPEIAAILASTYENHPSVTIFEGAVSSESGEMILYRVRPDLWESTEMPYLKDAPAYRAPSGFASTDREHVQRHVEMLRWRSNGRPVAVDEAIEALRVPTRTLGDLATSHPNVFPVDVLQVDVEGIDDRLVLAALESGIFPLIINFEALHLPLDRRAVVETRLEESGYRLAAVGGDLLAVRTRH